MSAFLAVQIAEFQHEEEKDLWRERVRRNHAPPVFSEQALVERLASIIGKMTPDAAAASDAPVDPQCIIYMPFVALFEKYLSFNGNYVPRDPTAHGPRSSPVRSAPSSYGAIAAADDMKSVVASEAAAESIADVLKRIEQAVRLRDTTAAATGGMGTVTTMTIPSKSMVIHSQATTVDFDGDDGMANDLGERFSRLRTSLQEEGSDVDDINGASDGGLEGKRRAQDESPLLRSEEEKPTAATLRAGRLSSKLMSFVSGRHVDQDDADKGHLKKLVGEAVELFRAHPACFERVALETRFLDDSLTPRGWMLLLDAIYCIVLFIFSIDDGTARAKGKSPWITYEVVYFRILNSTALSSFLVSSVVRCILTRQPVLKSTYVRIGLVILFPAILTHCLPACVVYFPIIAPIVMIGIVVERAARAAFSASKKRNMYVSFLARGGARVLVNFTTSVALSLTFNLAILWIYHRGEGGAPTGWWDAVLDEYRSRNVVCTLDSVGESVANVLQSLASITVLF